MNQYKKYMDRQGVSPSLHARLTALAEGDGPAPAGRAPHRYRWGILAACGVRAAGLAWAGGVRQPDGAAQAYSMDSAGMQSAQSGAAHQGSSEAMEEDEKQLSPPVWAVNYPDIGTLSRFGSWAGTAASWGERPCMPLRGPGSGSQYGGAESGRRRRPLSPSPWLRETCPPQGRPSPAGQ